MSKLAPELFKQIRSICEHASKLNQMGEEGFAISKYYEALNLVPDPKSGHKISTYIYTSLGEIYFADKNYADAGMCFLKAYKCPDGDAVAQISFRIGQCLEECGERKKAQDYLCQAYLLDGEEIFHKANPKYYKIIRSEVEGTEPEDEIDYLRENDDYDILNGILSDTDGATPDYTGYSGSVALPRGGERAYRRQTSGRTEGYSDRTAGHRGAGGESQERVQSRSVERYADDADDERYDSDYDEDERRYRRNARYDDRGGQEDDDGQYGYDDDFDVVNDEPQSFGQRIWDGFKRFLDLFR